jgi:hypothetical protein
MWHNPDDLLKNCRSWYRVNLPKLATESIAFVALKFDRVIMVQVHHSQPYLIG